MSGRKGQNLVEFSIVIALVAIVCIVVLTMLGVNINSLFNSSYKKVADFQPFGVNYDKDTGARTYKAGELGGTAKNPKSECAGKVCAIDYGDFVLNGIPLDYGTFVESSGTSGGTDSLSDLLKQIGEQINDTDTGDGNSAEDFKLIAQLGHFSAAIQRAGESATKECSTSSDPATCYDDKNNNFKPSDIELPADLESLLTGWPTKTKATSYGVDFYSQILGKINVGNAAVSGVPYPGTYPSKHILDAYNRIQSADTSDGVTPQMKQIATEMLKQIDGLNDNLENTYFKFENKSGQFQNCDPITKSCSWDKGIGTGDITEIFHPQTSKNVDIRANIYCATGGFKPDGTKCN